MTTFVGETSCMYHSLMPCTMAAHLLSLLGKQVIDKFAGAFRSTMQIPKEDGISRGLVLRSPRPGSRETH